MSMPAMSQFSTSPPVLKSLPAKVTKIVFGSTRSGFESALAPSTQTKAIGISV